MESLLFKRPLGRCLQDSVDTRSSQRGLQIGFAMENCPTCLRPFEKMLDYPLITLDKVEIPEQGIATYLGCAKVNAEAIWKTAKSTAITNYLNTLSNVSVSGITLDPEDLLPGWPTDKYFKYVYSIYDENVNHILVEHKFLYIAFHQSKDDDSCAIELLQTGPNFGSAGGPTLETVGTIATLRYTPVLTVPYQSK